MILGHRIALDPNNAQSAYLARAAGTARFAYNWALAEWNRQYCAWKADNTQPRPNANALRRQLNSIKREQFPWMLEISKMAPQQAISQLGKAFANFFAGHARHPKFKRRGSTTVLKSPMTGFRSSLCASASLYLDGCACVKACASMERLCQPQFRARLIDGSLASL
ncbi:helix-turn-helix domain-containing protein [Burkholderia cepacia]|uniref:helix-turn-helix domain-containing protein n=1 Tax=Burkholderia cepacia TaxID=292 RepID=UPI0038578E76